MSGAVVGQIVRRDRHAPTAEAEQIRQCHVGGVLHGERNVLAHRPESPAWNPQAMVADEMKAPFRCVAPPT